MTREEMIEKLNGAHKAMTDAVARQWRGDVALEISIPARPDHDTDFLVCDPIREVLAALSSAPPDLVPEHVRKHSREVVDMYRGLKPSEQVSRGTLAAMAIGLLERWLTPAPETPAPVAPVDHAPMGMPGDAGHDQWGYPLSLRTSVPDSSPVAPAPPVAPEVLPPSGYKSPMQRHYETPEFKAAWAAGKAERDAASPVVAPAPVVEDATHLLWTGLVRYLDEQFGLALRPEHCLMIKSMLVNRAQPIDAPSPDRSEPIAAPAPVVETVTRVQELEAIIAKARAVRRRQLFNGCMDCDYPGDCNFVAGCRGASLYDPVLAALSPRETPDGGGR